MWVGNLGQGVARDGVEGKGPPCWRHGKQEASSLLMENQQYLSSGEWVMEGQRLGRENEKNFHNPISTSKDLHVKDMEEFSCFDHLGD